MGKLDGIDADELRARLADADDPKAVRRLVVALAYDDGESVETLSRRYGFPRSTIYYWLDRFESRPLKAALVDDPRPGRPRELTAEQRRELEATLADPPAAHGYDADEWTTELVRHHVASTYGVEYSIRHVRRLLREEFDFYN
jgi:transposase